MGTAMLSAMPNGRTGKNFFPTALLVLLLYEVTALIIEGEEGLELQ